MLAVFPDDMSIQPTNCRGAVLFLRQIVFVSVRGLVPHRLHAVYSRETSFENERDLLSALGVLHCICNIVADKHGNVDIRYVDLRQDLLSRSLVMCEHTPDHLGGDGTCTKAMICCNINRAPTPSDILSTCLLVFFWSTVLFILVLHPMETEALEASN
jgi:hypothetical protein